MTVKTTLSFTDRHRRYLVEKVGEGVFASASSAVAAAIEQLMQDEIARDRALEVMSQEIRSRLSTAAADYIDSADAFQAARTVFGEA